MLRRIVSATLTATSLTAFAVATAVILATPSEAFYGAVNCQYWINPATGKDDCHGDCPDPENEECVEKFIDENRKDCDCFPKFEVDPDLPPIPPLDPN